MGNFKINFQLERLIKYTPEGNKDKELLPILIDKLDKQIRLLNDAIAKAEFDCIVSSSSIIIY